MVIAPAIESFLALTLSSFSALIFISVLERARNARQKVICCLLSLAVAVLGAWVEFNSIWEIAYSKFEDGSPIGPILGKGAINLSILIQATVSWAQAVAFGAAAALCITGISKRSRWRLMAAAAVAAFSLAAPQLVWCLIAFLRDANFLS